MSRVPGFSVALAMLCTACAGPICPVNAGNPDEAAAIAAAAEATGRCIAPRLPTYGPDAVRGDARASVSDACAACVAAHCQAEAIACIPADSGVPCSAPDPEYVALTACITASCGEPCPGVP